MAYDQAKFTAQLQAAAKYFKEALIDFGRETATNNVVALTQAIEAVSDEGSYSAELGVNARNTRTRYANTVGAKAIRDMFDPIFKSYLRDVIGASIDEKYSSLAGLRRIAEFFLFSSPGVARGTKYSVKSRGITRDTSASESGTGDGEVYRLTVDRFGENIESGVFPATINFTCIQSAGKGTYKGNEGFRIESPNWTDVLDQGLGVTNYPIGSIQSFNRSGIVQDGSFGIGTAADSDPSSLGAWEDVDGTYGTAKYEIVDTPVFDSSAEEQLTGVALALKIKGNHTIRQKMTLPDLEKPIFYAIRYYPEVGMLAGTLDIGWGSKSQSFSLSADPDAWNLAIPTLDEDLYPFNFDDGDNYFSIGIDSMTAGKSCVVDCVRVQQFTLYGGTYWVIDPGTTHFLSGANAKTFGFTDTATEATIQRLLAIGYGSYLPSDASPTIADPTA